MPASSDSRKSTKSKKNSKKCSSQDKNEDNKNDLNNNKKISKEYPSLQSMVSLNNANNSCSSNSSITSPDTYLTKSVSTPFKRKTASKSNFRFHQLFPSISLDEIVISSNNFKNPLSIIFIFKLIISIFKPTLVLT